MKNSREDVVQSEAHGQAYRTRQAETEGHTPQ